jgi:hypothetical protein
MIFDLFFGQWSEITLTNMELLVFAVIAARNGYQLEEIFVSDPAQFRPFDLRALTVDSKRKSLVRTNRLVRQRTDLAH